MKANQLNSLCNVLQRRKKILNRLRQVPNDSVSRVTPSRVPVRNLSAKRFRLLLLQKRKSAERPCRDRLPRLESRNGCWSSREIRVLWLHRWLMLGRWMMIAGGDSRMGISRGRRVYVFGLCSESGI